MVGTLGKIAIVVLVISLFTFIALFGRLPALRKTPIGLLQRFLFERIPACLRQTDQAVTGARITAALADTFNYLVNEKNPVILIIFLTILSGSIFLFLHSSFARLPTSQRLPIPLLLSLPYLFTYLCASDRSIYITPQNHSARMHDYPYDHVLFHPGAVCRTCNLTKPARSKHCSLCKACVAKSDHHCPWINNCLGKTNYRWFLYLLLSLGVLEYYGVYLAYCILSPWIDFKGFSGLAWFSYPFWSKVGDEASRIMNKGGISIAGVGLLAWITAPLPLGLLAYHIYLIWAGMTTNESQKWSYWGEDMADGIVFRAKRSDVVARELEQRRRAGNDREGAAGQRGEGDSGEVRKEEHGEITVPWPVSSDQHIVQTTDGRPPAGREHLYTQIWSLAQVDNIYDLGFVDNLLYVLQGR